MNSENENKDLECVKKVAEACEKLSLKSTDNISRRNVLTDIRNIILSNDNFLQKDDQKEILLNIFKSLTFALSADSEKCREIAATALKDMCQRYNIPETASSLILSHLALRLGKTDEREKSEEVRLIEINLLYYLIERYDGDLLQNLSDISSILSNCILDECPELKRKSCECLSLLASRSSHFHMIGGTFLKPLLSTISHQHLKTRTLCIKALGHIVDYLNSDEFKEAVSHLSQRLFDRSPVVRMAATDVIGNMLLTLKDRYSYFHHLVPLMLSSLYDDVQEVRSKAQNLWNKAGDQYLRENEKDYKDLMDFPRPDPEDYPESDIRPSLGCRILVQRNIFTILPALVRDMGDWVLETRVKSSQVLYSLILHSEDKITIQLPNALEGIMQGAKDENKVVVEYALKSAELLGYFVDSPLLCDSILSLAHGNPTSVHLSILAAVLRGHTGTLPHECFLALCKFLSDPSVSRLRQAQEQANLLLCVDGLLCSGNEIDSQASYELFTTLTSISGLTTNDSIVNQAQELMKQLAQLQSCSEMFLFQQHSITFVQSLTENNELWSYHSPEMPIFHFIVGFGSLDERMSEMIFPVFINNLFPGKEAKLRSKMLSLLVSVFKKLSSSHYEAMCERILDLIRSGIFPNLTWSAGKTASALRILAAASLYEILNQSCIRKEMLKSLGDELLPVITTLSEDDEANTRLLSCKTLEIVLADLVGCIDDIKIHKACYEILVCMDDESEDVRLLTTRVLKAYVKSFPAGYDWRSYRAYLKHMFENVLIHLDDKNEKIKLGVFDLLKEVSYAAPDVLLEEIESKKYVMSASDLCDNLTAHIKKIKL